MNKLALGILSLSLCSATAFADINLNNHEDYRRDSRSDSRDRDDRRDRDYRGDRDDRRDRDYRDRDRDYDRDRDRYSYGSLDISRLSRSRRGRDFLEGTIFWNARQRYGAGVVTVSVRGEASDKLFACGERGSQVADWIHTNNVYVFKLYSARTCPRRQFPSRHELGELLDEVSIVRGRVQN